MSASQSISTVQIVCYNCNKIGHLPRNRRKGNHPSRRGLSSYDHKNKCD